MDKINQVDQKLAQKEENLIEKAPEPVYIDNEESKIHDADK